MMRMTALTCLVVTLFCPMLCLAEMAGEQFTHDPRCVEVCDAMAVGAVVADSVDGPVSPYHSSPAFDGVTPLASHATTIFRLLRSCDRTGDPPYLPPEATRRQALLQTFLF